MRCMGLIFVLSKEDIKLSAAEAVSLGANQEQTIGNLMLARTDWKEEFRRLAYTKEVHELLFISEKEKIEQTISGFDWNSIFKKDFSLTAHGNLHASQKRYADLVYRKLQKPKVKMRESSTEIHLFDTGKGVIAGRLKYRNREDFAGRNPNIWKEFHPSTLKPRLARAMINLTGIREGTITDPCCGAGGFLIEAGHMGLWAAGYDIDRIMVNRARTNLEQFGFGFPVQQKDCLELDQKMDYVVTDLPYSKNTRAVDQEFYRRFLKMLKHNIGIRAAVGFPDTIDVLPFANEAGLHVEARFEHPLHRNLVKQIFLFKACV